LDHGRRRASMTAGQHARRRAGSGSEFWQYRPLGPDEAVSRVDWRRSARSDDLFVREREREEPGRLLLFADGSGSMDFASREDLPTKAASARTLLTTLAISAREAEEHVGVMGARTGLRSIDAIHAALWDTEGNTPASMTTGDGDWIVASGDFLDEGSTDWLAEAAATGARGVILLIIDPAEAAFPFRGHTRFEPSEAGETDIDLGRAESLADRYHEVWTAHLTAIKAFAAKLGWPLVRHITSDGERATLRTLAAHLGGEFGQ
ncbi:MAG: DUF58 domain-containing protein, partial [Pacificimonas sp.]